MPKTQRNVLDLISRVTGGTIENETPCWLMRPGKSECGRRWGLVSRIYHKMTDSDLPDEMPPREWRRVDGILVIGRDRRIVEFDESQHFNCYRGMTLSLYPKDLRLAFDREAWANRSQAEPRQKSGNWAKPRPPLFPNAGGRHRQRAFRDALADILPPEHGLQPTLRIADFEVPWIGTVCSSKLMEDLLNQKIPR